MPPTLAYYNFDGLAALKAVISGTSYGSLAAAVAALTVFPSEDAVAQAQGLNVFRMRRHGAKRREFSTADPTVMCDDNAGPHLLFTTANIITVKVEGKRKSEKRLTSLQNRNLSLNHVYSSDEGGIDQQILCFTNLANLCVSPAFLARVTDNDEEIKALLRYRVFDLYGFSPTGRSPHEPKGYRDLPWARRLEGVESVEEALRNRLERQTEGSVWKAVKRSGWCFNGFTGDPFVREPLAHERAVLVGA